MYVTSKEEDLSFAYLQTLCAASGIMMDPPRHDEDGTDVYLHKDILLKDGREANATVRLQMKATASDSECRSNCGRIIYELKVKSYNDLVKESTVPFYLCLMILTSDENSWLVQTEDYVRINARMFFWRKCSEDRESSNKKSKNISIPESDFLTKEVLGEMLYKAATGERI